MKNVCFLYFCFLCLPLSAQWQYANGPYGGMIWDLKDNGKTAFATTQAGVFCLRTGSTAWEKCDTAQVHHLSVEGRRIYLVSYNHYFIRQSADQGHTWETKLLPDSIRQIRDWAGKGDTILITTNSHIWRSGDGGTSWQSQCIATAPEHYYNAIERIDSFFYVSSRFHIYRSTDGLQWSFVSSVPESAPNLAIFQLYGAADTLLAFTGLNLWQSSTGGKHWQTNLNGGAWGPLPPNFTRKGKYWYASAGYLRRSEDAGLTWNPVSGWMEFPADLWAIAVSGGNILMGSQSLGVLTTSDQGVTFGYANQGIAAATIFDVAVYKDTAYVKDNRGILCTRLPNAHWDTTYLIHVEAPFEQEQMLLSYHQGHLLLQADERLLLRLANGTFKDITPPGGSSWSPPMRNFSKGDTLVIWQNYSPLYASSNAGDTWQAISFPTGWELFDVVLQGDTLFAATSKGLFKATSLKGAWDRVCFLPGLPARLWATDSALWCLHTGSESALYLLDKALVEWKYCSIKFPADFPAKAFPKVSFWKYGKSLISAFEGAGVYMSHDHGLTWEPFNEGLPPARFFKSLYTGDRWLAAATNIGLFFRSADASTSTTTRVHQVPDFLIYPNPTSDLLEVRSMDSRHIERVEIYDFSGKLMLCREVKSAMYQESHLAAFLPASGMYRIKVYWEGGRSGYASFLYGQ
jgi:photosystem II stability/assembly factor-like uncharacterized protein